MAPSQPKLSLSYLISISIVCIHGLNPSNKENHAEATWTASNGKMWIRDFLPAQLPTARIFLFGYNANVAFETSIAGVDEHAENLLNRLKLKRRVRSLHLLGEVCVRLT